MAEPGSSENRIRDLETRLAALENVIKAQGTNVTLQVPGTLSLSASTVELNSSSRISIQAQEDVRIRASSDVKMVGSNSITFTTHYIESNVQLMNFLSNLEMRSISTKINTIRDLNLVSGEKLKMSATTDAKLSADGHLNLDARRDVSCRSRDSLKLSANDGIRLECGSALETLQPSGAIELRGTDIRVVGTSRVEVKGPGNTPVMGSKINNN